MRILIIEDEEQNVRIFKLLLEAIFVQEDNLSIQSILNADQALAKFTEADVQAFDFVLADVEGGGKKSGIDLFFRWKEFKSNLPILVISGRHCHGNTIRDAGGVFLGKPFVFAELQEAVKQAMPS